MIILVVLSYLEFFVHFVNYCKNAKTPRYFYFYFSLDMNCAYEKEQQRLMRLFEEVQTDEEPDDEEDDEDNNDCVENREDSDTEQEGENESENFETNTNPTVPCFTSKNGIQWNKHPFSQRVRTSKANI